MSVFNPKLPAMPGNRTKWQKLRGKKTTDNRNRPINNTDIGVHRNITWIKYD